MSENQHKNLKQIVAEIKTMRCNCDLDNWEPDQSTGHSHVCRIHNEAIRLFRLQPQPEEVKPCPTCHAKMYRVQGSDLRKCPECGFLELAIPQPAEPPAGAAEDEDTNKKPDIMGWMDVLRPTPTPPPQPAEPPAGTAGEAYSPFEDSQEHHESIARGGHVSAPPPQPQGANKDDCPTCGGTGSRYAFATPIQPLGGDTPCATHTETTSPSGASNAAGSTSNPSSSPQPQGGTPESVDELLYLLRSEPPISAMPHVIRKARALQTSLAAAQAEVAGLRTMLNKWVQPCYCGAAKCLLCETRELLGA